MTLRELARALGGEVRGHQVLAPGPGHSPKDRSLAVKPSSTAPEGFVVFSHAGDDPIVCKDYVRERSGLAPFGALDKRPAAVVDAAAHFGTIPSPEDDLAQKARTQSALRLWQQSVPLKDTLGFKYFTERRGLHIRLLENLDLVIRWHEGIGAVVALMTNSVTSEPTGIHRTFIAKDATKIERKMLGHQGVVRLSPDEEVLEGLGICEGLETSLRTLLDGWTPVWCVCNAGGIERFPVLSGIEALTIFVDDDETKTGINAAQPCAERWTEADREVRLARTKDAFDHGI
jgi:putative DNA primase/helicase